MAIAFRSAASATLPSGTSNVTLPAGVVTGDVIVLACTTSNSSPANSIALGSGLTQLYNSPMGTSVFAIGWKTLTSSDITTSTVSITIAQGGSVCAIVAYSGVSGIGTAGTPTSRTVSSTSITATSVALGADDIALVIRGEKSTNNPGPTTASPAITERVARYSNGTAAPSILMGDMTPSQTVTFTDPVASGNGTGIQFPLLAIGGPPPSGPTVSVWDGTTEITGCTVSVWDGTTEITGASIDASLLG